MTQKKIDRDIVLAEVSGEHYTRLVNEYQDELNGMIGVSCYLIDVVDSLMSDYEEYTKAMEYEAKNMSKRMYTTRWDYFEDIHNTCLDWYFIDKARKIIERDYPRTNAKNKFCNDIDGNPLKEGDAVVVLDNSELEGLIPSRGEVLMVTECVDKESNYLTFNDSKYGFYGHRVLKLNNNL